MDASSLATLPPEARNSIYELLLEHEDDIWLDHVYYSRMAVINPPDDQYADCKPRHGSLHSLLALPSTCKQVYEKSIQVFYADNRFVINYESGDLDDFLATIGKNQAYALRAMTLISVWDATFDHWYSAHSDRVLSAMAEARAALINLHTSCQVSWGSRVDPTGGDIVLLGPDVELNVETLFRS